MTTREIIDGLEMLCFFNQRAGRELWGDKPKQIQDKDIEHADRILCSAISALQASKTIRICDTCKHDPPEMDKWPCMDCDMREPADRWEAKDVPDINVGDMISRKAAQEKILRHKRILLERYGVQCSERIDGIKQGLQFAIGHIAELPSAQPNNQVHLCDSCRYVYPECSSGKDDVIFGNGKGNDNICACNKYEPSAQSESTRTFVELVVEYLDPELCTYKEYKGKPYFSIKYIENGEGYIGYGTYSPKVMSQYLREYFMVTAQPDIVRCKDCKHRDPEDKKCDCGHDILWQLPRRDDWFCADSERRNNNGD